jgi:hypothetical protein
VSGQGVAATARAEGVPVSSMYHYLARSAVEGAPPAEQAFFNDPAGLDLLHRIVAGAHLVFCLSMFAQSLTPHGRPKLTPPLRYKVLNSGYE